MKIGLVRQRFGRFAGGNENYAAQLIQQLVAAGHEVHLLARDWVPTELPATVMVHRVWVPAGPTFLRLAWFATAAPRVAQRIGCDVVFSLHPLLRQDVCRTECHREWLRQRRLPSWHRALVWLNPLHQVKLWIERQCCRPDHTRALITNSHRGKREIVQHYGFPAERIHPVHNGVDLDRFRPTRRPRLDNEVVLLFVGLGFARKGLAYAIRALAGLPAHVTLRVVGKGNARPYRRLAVELGVAGRVQFLGPQRDMPAVYANADILVHPALYEAFANVCLEALACGLPVVTSRINGASEVLTEGVDGAIVEEPWDISALATAIRTFLDPADRATAAEAARRTAEAHPFARNVAETIAVLEKLITQDRQRPNANPPLV